MSEQITDALKRANALVERVARCIKEGGTLTDEEANLLGSLNKQVAAVRNDLIVLMVKETPRAGQKRAAMTFGVSPARVCQLVKKHQLGSYSV